MSRKSISKYSNVKTWVIENYLSFLCKNGDCLCSLFHDDGELQIKLFPRGALSSFSKFISCFLEMKNRKDELELDCKLEMTDKEGNVFVEKKFRIKSFEQNFDVGFVKFISTDEVLAKMAESKYDSLIVKFHVNKFQRDSNSITEFVARTIKGIEKCFFTWYLESLGTDLKKKTTIHFPKSSKMEFHLSASETDVIIAIIHFDYFDDLYRMETELDDVERFNLYEDEFLLCKISFQNIEGEILLTHLSFMEFEDIKSNSRQCCYNFKKDLFRLGSIDEAFPLQCEICITFGTYIKHINSEEVLR